MHWKLGHTSVTSRLDYFIYSRCSDKSLKIFQAESECCCCMCTDKRRHHSRPILASPYWLPVKAIKKRISIIFLTFKALNDKATAHSKQLTETWSVVLLVIFWSPLPSCVWLLFLYFQLRLVCYSTQSPVFFIPFCSRNQSAPASSCTISSVWMSWPVICACRLFCAALV